MSLSLNTLSRTATPSALQNRNVGGPPQGADLGNNDNPFTPAGGPTRGCFSSMKSAISSAFNTFMAGLGSMHLPSFTRNDSAHGSELSESAASGGSDTPRSNEPRQRNDSAHGDELGDGADSLASEASHDSEHARVWGDVDDDDNPMTENHARFVEMTYEEARKRPSEAAQQLRDKYASRQGRSDTLVSDNSKSDDKFLEML